MLAFAADFNRHPSRIGTAKSACRQRPVGYHRRLSGAICQPGGITYGYLVIVPATRIRFDGGHAHDFRSTVRNPKVGKAGPGGYFKKRYVLSKVKTISLSSSRSAHQRNHQDSMPAFRSSAQSNILEKNCTSRILPLIQNRTADSYRPGACGRLSVAIS